jgi:CTP-dependent riboflavin kinase
MSDFIITSATYGRNPIRENEDDIGDITCIKANIDGREMTVPLDPKNVHYAKIIELVEAGELTIEEAE